MKKLTVIGEIHPENVVLLSRLPIFLRDKFGKDIKNYEITTSAFYLGLDPQTMSFSDVKRETDKVKQKEINIIKKIKPNCVILESRRMVHRYDCSLNLEWVFGTFETLCNSIKVSSLPSQRPSLIDKLDKSIIAKINNTLDKYESVVSVVGSAHVPALSRTFSNLIDYQEIYVPEKLKEPSPLVQALEKLLFPQLFLADSTENK